MFLYSILRCTMTNLNRRGSLSETSIERSCIDSVFVEEEETLGYIARDDGLVNGLIPRISISLTSQPAPKTWEKRDLTRSRSLPDKNEIASSKSNRHELPELEALEACYWLRATGFPQYAQMYEDSLFPIDIAAVAKDHDFLDKDSIEALFRRLQTLNNCAKLKLHPRKIDEYDSDDEELIALSSRWKLQRKNRKWSRRKISDDTLKVSINDNKTSPKSSRTIMHSIENHSNHDNIININHINNNAALELLYSRLNERRPSLYDNLSPNNQTTTRNSLGKSSLANDDVNDSEVRSPMAKRRPGNSSSQFAKEDILGSSPDDQSSDEEDVSNDLELVKSLNEQAPRTDKPKAKKARWHSFQYSKNPRRDSTLPSLKISNLSAGQLAVLRKLSLLKLTALIERYSTVTRGLGWSVPRIFKKMITPDYKGKNVFGVPFSVNVQRSGYSLPKTILCAIHHLRQTALQSVGLFRRSGGKQRIHQLKTLMESNPEMDDFQDWAIFDIADVLKIYFRELPEPLLTVKLADTFLSIHQHVPKELRLGAMQAVVLLMPDENREALQSLLLFLHDVAQQSNINQMTASNLAVCFVPAFFHLCGASDDVLGAKRVKRPTVNKAAKDLTTGLDAQECITQMITEVRKLFAIPQDTMMKCKFSYIEQGEPVDVEELGKVDGCTDEDYHSYLETCIASILKESRLKFKNWVSHTCPETNLSSIDISYKKVRDGYPLRLWKATAEIHAEPEAVMKRIVHDRKLWDEDLLSEKVLRELTEDIDIYQYITRTSLLHPPRDHVVLRAWRSKIDNGKCVIATTSVAHTSSVTSESIRTTVLASRYLIEPIDCNRSRLTHVYRVDLRGRSPEWYHAAMPAILANVMLKLKKSFLDDGGSQETNV
ncbi:rho GTPase-activating protein 7-like isoform X2 [Xenia sp. Carnegie-2017]|uniref:rho GTPase-activating protein 7-like isoform X2 n=1 Tax=Xenia sp. Carnegie-2017 TaxID=2897299 RepID=UPI001F0484D3|nr:rho GTPase-activating protein 7-like isoform X2 [Xenia sp. Carnegie-2017]